MDLEIKLFIDGSSPSKIFKKRLFSLRKRLLYLSEALAKKGLPTGNCNQLGKRKTLETLMFRFDTSYTYYHLHTEKRGEKK